MNHDNILENTLPLIFVDALLNQSLALSINLQPRSACVNNELSGAVPQYLITLAGINR